MQCAVLGEIGEEISKSLRLEERPCPAAEKGEVLVEVCAVGINMSDVKATMGAFPYAASGNIAGRDCCGRVVDGPSDMVGNMVWSTGGKERGLASHGGLAQFTKLPISACLPIPPGVNAAQAAAMGVPLCTAACIISKIQIRAGETIVVTGANGQVARFVMGIAKWKGARTVGITRREMKLEYADHSIVSAVDESIIGKLKDIGDANVIVDTVGIGSEYLIESLAHHGRIVLLSCPKADSCFPLYIRDFYRKDLTLHSAETMQYGAVKSAEIVQEVLPAFIDGALTPPKLYEEIFTLDRVHEGYQLVGNGCPTRVLIAPNGIEALKSEDPTAAKEL